MKKSTHSGDPSTATSVFRWLKKMVTHRSTAFQDSGTHEVTTYNSLNFAVKKRSLFGTTTLHKALFLVSTIFAFGTQMFAQVTVSGGTTGVGSYTTIEAAVVAINGGGAFSAPVVVDVVAGHSETPSGKIVLNATGTMANPLTIQKSGAGANPVINGFTGIYAGVTISGYDAMFVINGSDYVTIDGIDLNNTAAAASASGMEIGYALIRGSVTNGSQNNTIKNCAVALNAQWGVYGVAITDYSLASFTAVVPTAASGTNSYNTVKSCTISGGNTGVFFRSYAAPSPYTLADFGNTIGGNSSVDGNTITNFGGYGAAVSAVGVFVNNQYSYLVKYNTINNNTGTHIDHIGNALRGVFCNISGQGASGEVSNNDISLKYGGTTTGSTISSTTTTNVVGIDMRTSSSTSSGNSITVNNNYIHNFTSSTSTTIAFAGIVNGSLATTVQINGNEITDINFGATAIARYFYGILNFQIIPGLLTIQNNNIHDITNLNSTTTIYAISNSTGTPNLNVSNNTMNNFSRVPANGGTMYGYYNGSSITGGSYLFNNNDATNFANGTGSTYPLYISGSATNVLIFKNCLVNNISNASGTGTMYGIYAFNGAVGSVLDSNTVTNISHLGTGTIYGIAATGSAGTRNISNSLISGLTSGGTIYGLSVGGSGNTYKNKIFDLTGTSIASSAVYGMYVQTGTFLNVYNNLVYNLANNTSTSTSALGGMYIGSTDVRVVNNTIYPTSGLSYTGTATSGAAGIYILNTTTGVIDNNIISISESAFSSTGYVSAIKRGTAGTAGVAPSSLSLKGNILNGPYLFGEGTTLSTATNVFHTGAGSTGTADIDFNTTCGAFKAYMVGNAAGSFTEDNLTFSGGAYSPSGASYAESGAIAGVLNPVDDFDGVTRGTPADIGALEFSGSATDAASPTIAYTSVANQNCANPPSIVATISDASGIDESAGVAPRLYYKKSTDANVFDAGVSTNDAAYNGWKYVQTSSTGGTYVLAFDYSKLQSAVVVGDVIQYFVVAQDLNGTPNVGNNVATYTPGVCPTSVELPAGAFPVSNTPSFTINVPANITVTASPLTVCALNNVNLNALVTNAGIATVGAGLSASSTYSPYTSSTLGGKKVQTIFTPAELNAVGIYAGNISGIALDVTTTTGLVNIPDLKISMGHTTTSTATTTFDVNATTTVLDYASTSGYTPVFGWNQHTFTTPFNWNGTSNLVIEYCHTTLGVSVINSVSYTTVSPAKCIYTSVSGTNCATTTGTTTTLRPNVRFNAQLNLNAAYNFSWSDGTSGVGSGAAIVANPAFPSGPMTYTVTAGDVSGCSVNGNVVVTENTTTPTGTASASGTAICYGDNTLLSSTVADGCPPYSYSWSDGSTVVSTLASFTATPLATTTYTLTITDNAAQTFSPAGILVSVNNPLILTTSPATRCGAGTLTLGATTGVGNSIAWYNQAVGGVAVGSGTSFVTPSILTTTDYYVAAYTPAPGSTVVQGAGASTSATYSNPFYSLWSNIHTQHVITAAELTASGLYPGNITSVALDVTNAGTLPMIDLSVKIGTTANATAAAFDLNPLTTVYSSASLMPTLGLNTLTFSTPFNWDGTSNIILEFCHGNAASSSTMSRTVKADATSYVSTIKANPSAATSSAASCSNITTGLLTYSVRPQFTFTGVGACEGVRDTVTATVIAPPAISTVGDTTICNNQIHPLTVTSTIGDFDEYTWTPSANLFTDALATVPYVAGSNYSTVYYKNATGETVNVVLTGFNTTSGCQNLDTAVVINMPALTISGQPDQICISGSTELSLSPATGYGTGTVQWQTSTTGLPGSYTDVVGQMGTVYITPVLSSTTWYGVTVTDGLNTCANNPTKEVIVNNPLVVSTTDSIRCGVGSVTLLASGNSGASMNWYANATGGSPLGTGNTFNTPSISATDTFYVAAMTGGTVQPVIPGNAWNQYTTLGSFQTTNLAGANMAFTASVALGINSMDIYPSAALGTSFTLEARLGSTSGAIAATYTGTTTVVNSGSPTAAQTLSLGWNLPAGTYYIGFVNNPSTWRSGLITHPVGTWNIPGVCSLDYSLTPSYQYYLYNPIVSTGCESGRTAVVATVTAPPALTLGSSASSICVGDIAPVVNVTSIVGDYDTYVWTPSTGVTGNATSGYFFNPAVTTTYGLTASNSTSLCVSPSISYVVTVLPTPTATISVISDTICAGSSVVLTGSALTVPFVLGSGITAITANGHTPYTGGWEGQSTQYLYTAAELTALNLVAGPISGLSFNVSNKLSTLPYIGYSINMANTTATSLSAADATGTFTTVYGPTTYSTVLGTNTHTFATPFSWDGTSNVVVNVCYANDPAGTGGILYSSNDAVTGTSTTPNVYVRGRYADNTVMCGSTTGGTQITGTVRPNITLIATPLLTYLWSPGGEITNSITVSPTSNASYSVTVTNGVGCTGTASQNIVVNNPTSSSETVSVVAPYVWSANGTSYSTSGVYTHTLVNAVGCDSNLTLNLTILPPPFMNLTVTMFIEGYYDATSGPAAMFPALYNNDQLNGGTTVAANAVDSVTIELVDATYTTVYSANALLLTDGTLSVTLPGSAIGGSYYIRAIHKNSLNLWSSVLVPMTVSTAYNFSTSLSSAATDGSNAPMATLASGLYGLYSGDLNKDGFIDNFDYPNFTSDLDDSAYNFLFFLTSDLNGDGFVDSFDYPMYSFNNGLGVYEQYP